MEGKGNQFLKGIDTVVVRVSDIEASTRWYTNQLGLTPIWNDPQLALVVFDTYGPTSLTLWQSDQKPVIPKDTACYPIFKTQDASALREDLLSRGVEVGDLIQDEHVQYFFFFDPDANALEACQVRE
jgi:catechol-2,3-dioxygenase